MIVFRLSKEEYRNDLSGKGAELAGGRWNSKGTAILYTAENRSLCTAEIAVHAHLGVVPKDFYMISIKIPNTTKIETVNLENLSGQWKKYPYIPDTKDIGDTFIKRNLNLVLKVPSAVIQGEYNYLINPNHNDFANVEIIQCDKFEFDRRLFK